MLLPVELRWEIARIFIFLQEFIFILVRDIQKTAKSYEFKFKVSFINEYVCGKQVAKNYRFLKVEMRIEKDN